MGDDKTLIAALGEEGGQQIYNEAVLRRLRAIEKHNVDTDARLGAVVLTQLVSPDLQQLNGESGAFG